MGASAAERALLDFFERVAGKDETQLHKLRRCPKFRLESGQWCFTLPDLHRFLQDENDVFAAFDYKKFRGLILKSPVNRAIKGFGAEIAIAENRGKVDRSRYVLNWRT